MKTNRSNKLFEQTRIATLGLQDLLAFGQLQPDGTYKVRNVTNSNFLNAIVISEQITYADLLALATANELVAGKNYTITDAVSGTMSLYVFAVSISNLAEYGYDTTTGQVYSYDLATDTASNADNTGFINFTPQTAPAYQRGRMWYDSTTETVSYYDDITGTSVQVGQEELVRARNSTGSTILNGAVVYISGAQGQNPRISLAQANAESTSRVIGVATHNISNNTVGKVCTFGIVGDLNTSAYNEGDVLYLSTSVAGGLTTTRPSAPNQAVMVGTVIHSAVNDGKILVHTDNYGIGYGTANQVRGINAAGTAEEYKTLTGTSNQVTVTHTSGVVTFSLPQNIATNSDVVFNQVSAQQFVKPGGTGSQFLKANGTVDSTAYIAGFTLAGEVSGSGSTFVSVTLDNAAVTGKVLTGLSVSGSAIVSTDSILTALGKAQNQINALAGGVNYRGTWNASTNSPSLASGVGTQGYYYVVTVAGSTDLDGITDWKLGDWAIYNGTAWQKVDNTDAVVSVNGYMGIVTLSASDVGALPTSAISGTAGKLAKFTSSGAVGDSIVSESGIVVTVAGTLNISTGAPNIQFTDTTNGIVHYVEGTDTSLVLYSDFNNTQSGSLIDFRIDGNTTRMSLSATELITFGATDTGEAHIFGGSARINGSLLTTGSISTTTSNINVGNGTAVENLLVVDALTYSGVRFARGGVNKWAMFNNNAGSNFFDIYNYDTATTSLSITPTNQIITNVASNTGEHFIVGGSARVNGNLRSIGRITSEVLTTGAAYHEAKNTNGSTFFGNDGTGGYIITDWNAPILFYTNNLVRGRWSADGNFGVGVNPTNAKLEVVATSGEIFRADANGGAGRIIADQTGVTLQGTLSFLGASTFTSTLTVSGGGSTNGRLGVRGTTNDSSAYAFEAANSSGSTLFIARNDGVVSVDNKFLIGTFTPGASKLSIVGLPTSASGLSTGDVWNDGGTLKIV